MPTLVEIRNRLESVFNERQAIVLAEVINSSYNELVKTSDFNELKGIVKEIGREVKELAGAQKRTEIKVEELAGAQKKTEIKVEELAEAQRETQVELKRLAKAQIETQVELKRLAKAQIETQEEVKGLTNAQKETQIEVKGLAVGLKNTRQDLGGVTSTLGYMLENESYRVLPGILKGYGIETKERFLRRSIKSFGISQDGEVNIFSRGIRQDGKKVAIIGEAKSQIGKEDIDNLLIIVEKLEKVIKEEKFLLVVTHYAKETIIEYAKEKGVVIIQSFEW